MNPLNPTESAWAPLRVGVFRALWFAGLAASIGDWMQTVGAQWLLVAQPHASILVPLVQTADLLPVLLVGLPAGVLADIVDRRLLLIGIQGFMTLAGVALALLTLAGQMPPALLLMFIFVLGIAGAMATPALQALTPDLVPRAQVESAAALGAISVNLARAVGPAIAGVLIARTGAWAVFAVNTATFAGFGLVLALWRPAPNAGPKYPERFGSALWAGYRYVRHAPVVRRIILRAALFLMPASALWALLPVVASEQLGMGPSGYGLLLGALGVGAIGGVLVLPRIRARLSINAMLFGASSVFAVALLALVLVPNPAIICAMLVPTGAAWIAVLVSISAALQLFLPKWVRARGLAVNQMILLGTQALSALVWGIVASQLGLLATFLIASAVTVAGMLTIRRWPLIDTSGMGRDSVVYWNMPQLVFEPEPDNGPVAVEVRYTIAAEKDKPFLKAMVQVRESRLRTGATDWGLYRDGETPDSYVELFVVPSWKKHLRQHNDRLTGADRQFQEEAQALSDPPPQASHLLAVDIPG